MKHLTLDTVKLHVVGVLLTQLHVGTKVTPRKAYLQTSLTQTTSATRGD